MSIEPVAQPWNAHFSTSCIGVTETPAKSNIYTEWSFNRKQTIWNFNLNRVSIPLQKDANKNGCLSYTTNFQSFSEQMPTELILFLLFW